MKRKLILLLITAFAASCNDTPPTQEEETSKRVAVAVAKKEYHAPELEYSGTVFPWREANLGASVPGRVEKIHYSEGTQVAKGALIAELSAEPMTMAEAEYRTLEKDYERMARLLEKESVTRRDYDHVKGKYEAAKARYLMMKKNTRITAPFSGTIVEYLVNEGETFLFSPGLEPGYSHTSGIVRLIELDTVKVEISVNERHLSMLEKGLQAEVVSDAVSEEGFPGILHSVKPVISLSSRTAKAAVMVKNTEGKLIPGMHARVRFALEGDSLVFIPRAALVGRPDEEQFVWVVKDGQVEKQSVVQRLILRDRAAVDHLEPGSMVVRAGMHALSEGDKVIVE